MTARLLLALGCCGSAALAQFAALATDRSGEPSLLSSQRQLAALDAR